MSIKESNPATEPPKDTATNERVDLSSIFISQYNTKKTPLDNKKVVNIIDQFVASYQNSLSSFLGKKITLQFKEITFCNLKQLELEKTPCILSSFQLTPQNQTGLIYFDYVFMHHVIDILFGAGMYKTDNIITSLGKYGVTITGKVVDLCIESLQLAITEQEETQIKRIKTTERISLIINQPMPDSFFHLTFDVNLMGVETTLNVLLPDGIIEDITVKENMEQFQKPAPSSVNTTLKKDIIDSTVTLIATLQDIHLKITDIMNLKTGDTIPIQDPTMVYLLHNNKKIFKGSAGQSNDVRVVKILETL